MKETPNHKIRYPEPSDNNNTAGDMQRVAEDTERELDAIAPKQMVGGAAGQLLIVDSTGAAAFKAMKGDATISEDATISIGDGKVSTKHVADNAITTAKLADKSVTAGKLVDGAVSDPKLASPNNSVWRHIASAEGPFNLDRAAGVWAIAHGGPVVSGGNFQNIGLTVLRLDAADYAVSGKTTKVRVAAQLVGNSVTPNTDFRIGLRHVEPAGGAADAIPLFITGQLVGPATFEAPAAAALLSKYSAEATLVSGFYVFAVETTATLANNAAVHLSAQLQMRHV